MKKVLDFSGKSDIIENVKGTMVNLYNNFKCEEKADITNEEELLRKLSGNLR